MKRNEQKIENTWKTEDAIEYAKNNDIRLVSFEMM